MAGAAPLRGAGPVVASDPGALAEAALGSLRAQGQRVTPARRAVVRALAGTDAHLRADDVCALVEAAEPGVHRATVYRTLESLADLGVVTHVRTGRGATVHHLASRPPGAHLHACCSRCGRVDDVPADLLDGARARLVRETGFALDPEHVALSGTCRDCSEGGGVAPAPRGCAATDDPAASEGAVEPARGA